MTAQELHDLLADANPDAEVVCDKYSDRGLVQVEITEDEVILHLRP